MKNSKAWICIVCVTLVLLLSGVAVWNQRKTTDGQESFVTNTEKAGEQGAQGGETSVDQNAADYGRLENWAYFSIGDDKAVDLFLVCPTVDINDEYNMSLEDVETKANFLGALNMERGIYEDVTRMFAPYYRQAAMKVYGLDRTAWEPYMEIAYADVSAAFSYYLEKENQGRPIVLAGFSQGADMCYRLLEEYFGDGALYDQLVAVYAIGWPCTEEMVKKYPQIKPATGEEDLGVVISFDCEAPEVSETFIIPVGTKAYAINPLNWKTDGAKAERNENKGACFTDYSGSILREEAGLCGCYIDTERGALKVTDVNSADYPAIVPGLPEGGYHVYDYQFFFRALQQNVALRTQRYIAKAEKKQETHALAYWNPSSAAMQSLVDFVKESVDETSEGYIPVQDRIAVFDMDGTLTCETYFTYYDTCMFIDYCLKDHPERVSEELKDAARELKPGYVAGEELARNFAKAYAGMTVQELYDYAVEFGKKNTESFQNMRYIDGFYLPMVEVVKFLYENDYTIYVVSGTERTTTRAIVANSPIREYVSPNHVIGTEFEVKVKGHEDVASNMDYKYADGDELVLTGGFIQKNLNANKSIWIEREIGQRPVLAFGNSGSDTSMMNYALDSRNPYPSAAYMVVADDDEREWGTQNWEEKSAQYEKQGYVPISMKNDFVQIYPESVMKSDSQYMEPQESVGGTAESQEGEGNGSGDETKDDAA